MISSPSLVFSYSIIAIKYFAPITHSSFWRMLTDSCSTICLRFSSAAIFLCGSKFLGFFFWMMIKMLNYDWEIIRWDFTELRSFHDDVRDWWNYPEHVDVDEQFCSGCFLLWSSWDEWVKRTDMARFQFTHSEFAGWHNSSEMDSLAAMLIITGSYWQHVHLSVFSLSSSFIQREQLSIYNILRTSNLKNHQTRVSLSPKVQWGKCEADDEVICCQKAMAAVGSADWDEGTCMRGWFFSRERLFWNQTRMTFSSKDRRRERVSICVGSG